MKKVHYVLYICDDEIFFLNVAKDKIMKEKFKSIQEDQMINIQLFIDEFNTFLKKNNIKTSIFGENICIIKNRNINPVVLAKYNECLKEYFHKIEYINLEDLLKIDKDIGFLHITNNYIDYYFMKNNEKNVIRVNLQLFSNQKKAIHHIITTIYKPKKLIVFGGLENISKIAENISHDYNITTTFPEVHYNYIFEEYRK